MAIRIAVLYQDLRIFPAALKCCFWSDVHNAATANGGDVDKVVAARQGARLRKNSGA
jgi:hypothetical protein